MSFVMRAINEIVLKLQMEALRGWLAKDENRRSLNSSDLQFVLDMLNNKTIGIKGSDIFSISWSLISTVRNQI